MHTHARTHTNTRACRHAQTFTYAHGNIPHENSKTKQGKTTNPNNYFFSEKKK